MASSDENNHEFFDVLSGRKKGNTTAEAIRKALIEEAEAIEQVEHNPPEKLTKSELARLEVVKNELIKKGIFKENDAKQLGFISYLYSIQKFFADNFWQILKVAVLPVTLLITFLLYQLNQGDSKLLDIEHIVKKESKKIDNFAKNNINNSSVGAIYINANHAESEINKLKVNLIDAGADVIETRVNDSDRLLVISVTDKSKVEEVKTLLIKAGVKINGEPPYKVTVKSK